MLRRVVDQGVNFIDTADSYGPGVSESLIAKALYPYPTGLVIATKGGLLRPGPDRWTTDCRPEHLRQACADSLRRLRLDRIELYQLHAVDRRVPIEESIGLSSISKPRARSATSGCRTCRRPNWPAHNG